MEMDAALSTRDARCTVQLDDYESILGAETIDRIYEKARPSRISTSRTSTRRSTVEGWPNCSTPSPC
jgi:hypothetical protein